MHCLDNSLNRVLVVLGLHGQPRLERSSVLQSLLQNIRQRHVRYLNSFYIDPEPLDLRLQDGEHVLGELAAHIVHSIVCDIINETSDRLLDLERQVSIQPLRTHLEDKFWDLLLVDFQSYR